MWFQHLFVAAMLWFSVAVILRWLVTTWYGPIPEEEHFPMLWWRWIVWLWPISLLILLGLYVFALYLWGTAWYRRHSPFMAAWFRRQKQRWAK